MIGKNNSNGSENFTIQNSKIIQGYSLKGEIPKNYFVEKTSTVAVQADAYGESTILPLTSTTGVLLGHYGSHISYKIENGKFSYQKSFTTPTGYAPKEIFLVEENKALCLYSLYSSTTGTYNFYIYILTMDNDFNVTFSEQTLLHTTTSDVTDRYGWGGAIFTQAPNGNIYLLISGYSYHYHFVESYLVNASGTKPIITKALPLQQNVYVSSSYYLPALICQGFVALNNNLIRAVVRNTNTNTFYIYNLNISNSTITIQKTTTITASLSLSQNSKSAKFSDDEIIILTTPTVNSTHSTYPIYIFSSTGYTEISNGLDTFWVGWINNQLYTISYYSSGCYLYSATIENNKITYNKRLYFLYGNNQPQTYLFVSFFYPNKLLIGTGGYANTKNYNAVFCGYPNHYDQEYKIATSTTSIYGVTKNKITETENEDIIVLNT